VPTKVASSSGAASSSDGNPNPAIDLNAGEPRSLQSKRKRDTVSEDVAFKEALGKFKFMEEFEVIKQNTTLDGSIDQIQDGKVLAGKNHGSI
jgi:hypothetical protein